MKTVAPLEFELNYDGAAVQHVRQNTMLYNVKYSS